METAYFDLYRLQLHYMRKHFCLFACLFYVGKEGEYMLMLGHKRWTVVGISHAF